jgi:hypothetical protein
MATRSEARLGYVPHFEVTTVDGQRVRYDDIWQRRNLVLVLVNPQAREAGAHYASQLEARRAEFEREETAVVVTADAVPKLAAPAALVADRWGRDPPSRDRLERRVVPLSGHQRAVVMGALRGDPCPECPP